MRIGNIYKYQNALVQLVSEQNRLKPQQQHSPLLNWDIKPKGDMRRTCYFRGWFSDWKRQMKVKDDNAGEYQGSYMCLFQKEKQALETQMSQPMSEREFMAIKLRGMQAKLPAGETTLTVCDLGCGAGTGIFELVDFAEEIGIPLEAVGVDLWPLSEAEQKNVYSPEEFERFSRYIRAGKLSFFQSSITDLFPNKKAPAIDWTGQFHLVTALQSVRYTNKVAVIEEAYRLTAIGGAAYIDNLEPTIYLKDHTNNVFFDLDLFEVAIPYFRSLGLDVSCWPSEFESKYYGKKQSTGTPIALRLFNFIKNDTDIPLLFGLTDGRDPVSTRLVYFPLKIPEKAAPLKPFLSLIPPHTPSYPELPLAYE